MNRLVLFAVLLVSACGWEVTERRNVHLLARYIPEANVRKVHQGMSARQVVDTIGAPETRTGKGLEIWEYSIWRGENPGILQALRSSKPPKGQVLKARVTLTNDRVSGVEVVESSAQPFRVPPN